jgi:hypothetical protein
MTIMWLDLHAIVIDVSGPFFFDLFLFLIHPVFTHNGYFWLTSLQVSVTVVMTDTQTTVLPAARLPAASSAESHLVNRLWGLWA